MRTAGPPSPAQLLSTRLLRPVLFDVCLSPSSRLRTRPHLGTRNCPFDSVSFPPVRCPTLPSGGLCVALQSFLGSNGRRVEHRRPPGEDHKTFVPSNNQPRTELTKPFSLDELATGLSLLKPAKAAGLDDVGLLTEMLQHLGNKAKPWLLYMLIECTRTKHIPSIWSKAKVIAIPKPMKHPSSPKSYRPISLLRITYTLYERLILMRISSLLMRS